MGGIHSADVLAGRAAYGKQRDVLRQSNRVCSRKLFLSTYHVVEVTSLSLCFIATKIRAILPCKTP